MQLRAPAGASRQLRSPPLPQPCLPSLLLAEGMPRPRRRHSQQTWGTEPWRERRVCIVHSAPSFLRGLCSGSAGLEKVLGGSEMPQKVLEGPGRLQKAGGATLGQGDTTSCLREPPLVALSSRCCCILPEPARLLPQSQHHHLTRGENCCYSKTANAVLPSFHLFSSQEEAVYTVSHVLTFPAPALSVAEGLMWPSSRQVGAGAQQGFHQGLRKAWPGFHPSQASQYASFLAATPEAWGLCFPRSNAHVDPTVHGSSSAACN